MPYERSAQRVDQANGYKPKTMLTRMGEITFEVPQVRSSGFYPSALERGSRSEQSMNLALAEMYVQGVSTRKVITVLQQLVGPEISISSTQISRCAQKLDSGLEAWRTRPLDDTPYVLLDARYERVREGNQVVDCAVLGNRVATRVLRLSSLLMRSRPLVVRMRTRCSGCKPNTANPSGIFSCAQLASLGCAVVQPSMAILSSRVASCTSGALKS